MITAQAVSSLLLIEFQCFLQEPSGLPNLPKNQLLWYGSLTEV